MSAAAHLRRARAQATRFGRMTVEDAAELGAVFVQVASRQAKDAARGAGATFGRTLGRVLRSPRPGR